MDMKQSNVIEQIVKFTKNHNFPQTYINFMKFIYDFYHVY